MGLQVILGADCRAQTQRIVDSKPFKSSAIHRELLSYLAEKSLAGAGDELKEYAVGVDCLGKPTEYDPRQDSSVRMHVARLRQKLDEYYRTEGSADPIVVELPKGGFKLVFEQRTSEAEAPSSNGRQLARGRLLIAGLAGVVLAFAFYLALEAPRAIPRMPPLTPELQAIWEPILKSDRRLAVCLSVPVFAALPEFNGVVGPFAGDWESISKSDVLGAAKEAFHSKIAAPSYDYTNVATATGAFRLGQFLAGRSKNILLTRGDLVSLPELEMDNVVYLGSPQGNPQLQGIPAGRQFAVEEGGVRNLHPPPGQPEYLSDSKPGAEGFPAMHALITFAPSPGGNGVFVYLMGNNESGILAAAQAVTDETVARRVFAKVKRPDGKLPRYFQVVLSVKSMEDMPIDISYATHKELPGPNSR
jgi:hypothetical protein